MSPLPPARPGPWARWVAFTDRTEHPLPLALVRVLLSLVVLADLLNEAAKGMVTRYWRTFDEGGLSLHHKDDLAWVNDLSPQWGGPAAWLVTVLSLCFTALGVWVRPFFLLAVVAYAQLGHLSPPGDRAIDRLLRTAMLVLVFAPSDGALSLRRGPRRPAPAWARVFLLWVLIFVYLNAGVFKILAAPEWLGHAADVPLYRIMADPQSTWLPPELVARGHLLVRLGGLLTIVLELGAPLILTRFGPWWGLLGIALHLGIAAVMELGMFAWGMMSLYPLIFTPWILRWSAARTAPDARPPPQSPTPKTR